MQCLFWMKSNHPIPLFVVIFVILGITSTAFGSVEKNNKSWVPDDPNADPNWDWKQTDPQTLLYLTEDSGITAVTVPLPYYSGSGKAFQDLYYASSDSTDQDILSGDGWRLLYRDFGYGDRAPKIPSYILYNKYRGLVRWLFFVPGILDCSYIKAEMKHHSNHDVTRSFMHVEKEKAFLDDFSEESTISFLTEAYSGSWSYADFQLTAFDNNLPDDATFSFYLTRYLVGEVNLNGEINLASENIIAAKDAELDYYSAIKGGHKQFKQAEDWIETLYKQAYSPINDENGNFLEWDTNSLIDSWKAPIFDSIITLGVAGPIIAGAAGFLHKIVFGGSKAQDGKKIVTSYKGEFNIGGEITNSTPYYDFSLWVPGTHPGEYNPQFTPLYDYPLGIYSLATKPTIVEYAGFSDAHSINRTFCYNWLKAPVELVFNEHSGLRVTKQRTALVDTFMTTCGTCDLGGIQFVWGEEPGPFSILPDDVLARVAEYSSHQWWVVTGQGLVYTGNVRRARQLMFELTAEPIVPTTSPLDPLYIMRTYEVNIEEQNEIPDRPLVGTTFDLVSRPDGDNTYVASYSITAGMNYPIPIGSDDIFYAGHQITLTPGFEAVAGSIFSASVEPITRTSPHQPPSLETVIASCLGFGSGEDSRPGTETSTTLCVNHNSTVIDEPGKSSSSEGLPVDFALSGTHPNPFNPQITIDYDLPQDSNILIEVYNVLGQKVCTLVNGFEAAGTKNVIWSGTNDRGQKVGSGVYLVKMKTPKFGDTKKITLLK